MSTIAVLGAGIVGRTLATGWARAGHSVILGSRTPDAEHARAAADEVRAAAGAVDLASHRDAAGRAEAVVLTVPGDQAADLIDHLDGVVAGRVVIDTTNNLAPGASALGAVAGLRAADALAYRAFNTIGWEQMAQPVFGGIRSDLLFTGPDAELALVEQLITDIGFRPIHLGDDDAALAAVDAAARLWFLLAFARGHGRRLGLRVLTAADD